MLYILAVEDNPGIIELYELILSKAFPHELIFASCGNHAIEVIEDKGSPELIICDDKMKNGDGLHLVRWLTSNKIEVPYIISSATVIEEQKNKYPHAYGHIQKPKVNSAMIEMASDILAGQKSLLNYVPISISLLLRMGKIDCDFYVKLSYAKYVKVMKEGDTFISSDAERFYQKQIHHLFVTAPDSEKFIDAFEKNIVMMMASQSMSVDETRTFTLESLEVVERMAFNLGWNPEVMESAKKSISLAIKTVSSDSKILKLLRQKFKSGSAYSKHTSLLAVMTCCLAHQLGWTSESSQMKLAIAALMHDIAVDDENYNNIDHWNQMAKNGRAMDQEAMQYRQHPIEAVTMLRHVKDLPPDIDHIILQHHESEDGTGFPYKISASRISPMSTLFIISEDLINFIKEDDLENTLREFFKARDNRYESGMFKKVYTALKENIREVV